MTGYSLGTEHITTGQGNQALCGVICRGVKPQRTPDVCGFCLLLHRLAGMPRIERGQRGKTDFSIPPSVRMKNNTSKNSEVVLGFSR